MRAQKLIALLCIVAVWFSFNIGSSILAAQDSPYHVVSDSAATVSSLPYHSAVAKPFLASGTGLATVAASIVGIVLMAYNLLTFGKNGWGWTTVCMVGAVFLIFARLGVSLFREVSSANSIQDWDS